jgi:hypothetical protein
LTASNLGATSVNVGLIDITSVTQSILFEVDTGIPTPTVGLENPSDPSRTDEKIFRHKPSGLNSGTHTVAVTAKDSAGNQKSFSASFTLSN